MGKKDLRVDAYISQSADFAKPILRHLRELVHKACPEVEETIKWSRPHFLRERMLCSMGSFKTHCAFGFWKGDLFLDEKSMKAKTHSMGNLGRIKTITDLPPDDELIGYVQKAVELNKAGVATPQATRSQTKEPRDLAVPVDLESALKENREAFATFHAFSYSHKKEYVEWLTEAKTEQTREKRVRTTIEWLSEGKPRNWKYMARPSYFPPERGK